MERKKSRLLVVDDDPNVVEIFSHILAREGFEVVSAATGQRGLELAREKLPDLVLLDVGLTDMTGIEVCQQLKAEAALQDTLVVLISGAAIGSGDKVTGLEIGADDYILKSADWGEIRARIRTLMRLREATVALRTSEQHYRRLVEILPDGVSLVDPSGRLMSVNAQAAAMLGYENTEELLKKNAFDLTPPEEHERVAGQIGAALKEGILRDVETVVLRKNGERFPVELSIAALKDSQGQPSGLVCLWRDVTRRKQVEEVMRVSVERFRQIAENIREVFWITNSPKDEMIYVSPGYEAIWGRSCEELYAAPHTWLEGVHPEDRESVWEAARTKQAIGEYDEVYRIVRPDGTIRWIQDRAFPVRDEAGKVYRVVGIAEDVTERRQAEQLLRESEAYKSAIMQAALDGIITFDHTGRIMEVNFATEKMFGYQAKAMKGQVLAEILLPPSLHPWFELGRAKLFAADEGPILGSRIEITALRAHRVEFPVEISITRIELVGPPLFTAHVRDVSGRRRTETRLETLIHAFETTTETIFMTDLKDRITFVNGAFVRTYGYSEREVMGKIPSALLNSDVSPALAREIWSHTHTQASGWQGEVMHRRKDGSRFPVSLSTSQIRDHAGQIIGFTHVTHDITERRRSEEQLRLLADAVRSTRDLIFITDAENHFTFVNQAFRNTYGYADDELPGNTPELICSKGCPTELCQTVFQKTREDGWRGEMQHVTKSGREFPVSLSTSSIKNADGSILNLVFVARDISDRRRAQEALESSQQLQKAILDNLSDPVWLRDREGRFLAGNEPLAKFLGLPLEKVVGKDVAELGSEAANKLTSGDDQATESRQAALVEEKMADARGREAWFEILNSPILGEHGRVVGTVGFARNVTERKQVEDALRQLPRRIIEAQEAERLRVARDLHDGVNQVLASAKMRLRHVEERIAVTNPAGAEILARCEKLLVQALEENRRIAHNLRPSDLDELGLATACRNFCREAESRSNLKLRVSIARLESRLPPEVELGLFRIVQEAVNNVEKHAHAKTVRLRMVRKEEWLILTVQDDGRGFARKSPRQPGSQRKRPGIGLTNMEERATSLGGKCTISSTLVSGTTVTVKIPFPKAA